MMRIRLGGALALIAALATGCLKSNETPIVQPQGTFTGIFYKLRNPRYVNAKQIWDTTKINLSLQLSGNNFAVTGDTTLHAGSKGLFGYNSAYIEFQDNTIPAGNTKPLTALPKIHLAGTYPYQYDGSIFRLKAWNDTLVYFYDLKK
ncbi:hypothetical protein [Mucilaginibacter lacusdianchii]|uniref:hypothetical protein n=1 Tax=Mucilaginibacter lacusdianchii TaxID=2684211 RepID=UPI00131A8807|nr:hypothetical protein [Mucilaginibacter sp. JXJ CY 39]